MLCKTKYKCYVSLFVPSVSIVCSFSFINVFFLSRSSKYSFFKSKSFACIVASWQAQVAAVVWIELAHINKDALANYTVQTIQYKLYSTNYTVQTIQYKLYSTNYTVQNNTVQNNTVQTMFGIPYNWCSSISMVKTTG